MEHSPNLSLLLNRDNSAKKINVQMFLTACLFNIDWAHTGVVTSEIKTGAVIKARATASVGGQMGGSWEGREGGGRRREEEGGRAVRNNENIQDQDQLWGSLVFSQLELLMENIDFACFVKQRPVSLNQSQTNCSLLPRDAYSIPTLITRFTVKTEYVIVASWYLCNNINLEADKEKDLSRS